DFDLVDVDHNLRSDSASKVSFVKNYCSENGYRFFTTKWHQKPKDIGMEAAARNFRYDFFRKVMIKEGFDTLLTAHHNNDLAENILMKLIRSRSEEHTSELQSRFDRVWRLL